MENLAITREDRLLRVTLNRPQKRNALSFALCRELVEAFGAAERDPGVGAILLGAAGSVFCAGMDLDEVLSPDAVTHAAVHEELFTTIFRIGKPVVAAVNGPALGGGLGLAANAHIIVAVQGSTFGLTEIRLGMWPFVVFRAVALAIGERRATELALTGRIFDAGQALSWGLAQHVVVASELDGRAAEIAAGLASASTHAIQHGLAFLNRTRGLDWKQAGAEAARARIDVFRSADFEEGVRAFREKRHPHWPSRA